MEMDEEEKALMDALKKKHQKKRRAGRIGLLIIIGFTSAFWLTLYFALR